MEQILAVVKRPSERAKLERIDNTLKAMQDLVGGHIECVTTNECVIICNEDGIGMGLTRNCYYKGHMLFGVVVAVVAEGDELAGLSLDAAADIMLDLDYGMEIAKWM